MNSDIVEMIYEASILGELWPVLLNTISHGTDSAAGFLIARDANSRITSITNPGMEHIPREYEALDLFARSLRMPRMLKSQCADFVSDDDLMTQEEKNNDPGYTEFLFPRGWGHSTATVISYPDRSVFFVNFERTRKAGRYGPDDLAYLNGLRPHFGRALSLMYKTELRRIRDRVDALDTFGIAAMALDRNGRMLALNAAMQCHVPHVLTDGRLRVVFANRQADSQWQALLEASPESSASMPVRHLSGPMVAHLLPVVRQARDVFSLTARLLLLMPVVAQGGSLGSDVIQVLFDLTPAEARIAYQLAEARPVAEIADRFALSRETVRTHIKSIMRKTLTTRQVDLVSLLASGNLPGNIENGVNKFATPS